MQILHISLKSDDALQMKQILSMILSTYLISTHSFAVDDEVDVPGKVPPADSNLDEPDARRSNLSLPKIKDPRTGLEIKGKVTRKEIFIRGTIPLQEPVREPDKRNTSCRLGDESCGE